MSVTFFVSGDSDAVDPPTLILTNNQARDLLHWLGLPFRELCGSMWAADLAERIRRVLHPAVDPRGRAADNNCCGTSRSFVGVGPNRPILLSRDT